LKRERNQGVADEGWDKAMQHGREVDKMNPFLQKELLKKDAELEAKEKELQSEIQKMDAKLEAKDNELEALQAKLKNGCTHFTICLCVFVLGMLFVMVCNVMLGSASMASKAMFGNVMWNLFFWCVCKEDDVNVRLMMLGKMCLHCKMCVFGSLLSQLQYVHVHNKGEFSSAN
jgi:hypothetical protein